MPAGSLRSSVRALKELGGLESRLAAVEADNAALQARVDELAEIITAVRDEARRRMASRTDDTAARQRGGSTA